MKVHIYLGESLWELKIICLYEPIEVSIQNCTCKCFIPPVFFLFLFILNTLKNLLFHLPVTQSPVEMEAGSLLTQTD